MFTRPDPPAIRQDQIVSAMIALGFASGQEFTRDDVLTAFRRIVRECHPDTGGDSSLAAGQIQTARQARDILLRAFDHAAKKPDPECPRCKGSGAIRTGPFSTTECGCLK